MRRTNVLGTIVAVIATALSDPGTVLAQPIKWTTKAVIPVMGGTGRRSAMSFIIGSKVYVGGGYIASFTNTNEFYAYDTLTNTWTKKKDLPAVANRTAGIAFSANGKGYVGLGSENYLDISGGAVQLSDLWEYDPALDTWMARAPLPDTGRSSASCFVVNNKAYVVGGEVTNTSIKTADVWEYNPVTNSWSAKAPLPLGPIADAFAFALGTGSAARGYISCGSVTGVTGNKKTYAYDPATNSWAAKADYPGSSVEGGFAIPLNNKGYCGAGGLTFTVYSDTFYAYDPVAGSWSSAITSFPGVPRGYGVAVSFGTTAFLGGGWTYASGAGETFYQDWYKLSDTSAVTGIAGASAAQPLNLYPNPASAEVNIIAPPSQDFGTVMIHDITGRLRVTRDWHAGERINMSELSDGVYVVQLITSTEVYMGSLVKH